MGNIFLELTVTNIQDMERQKEISSSSIPMRHGLGFRKKSLMNSE